jgi:hypothetical protein
VVGVERRFAQAKLAGDIAAKDVEVQWSGLHAERTVVQAGGRSGQLVTEVAALVRQGDYR